ncbi:hypothetical protein XENOCAPTIV_029003, partial [Xenoophorus captivus]
SAFLVCRERVGCHAFMHICAVGNAAIVLRMRLQVQVLKENWEKNGMVDEKGMILTRKDTGRSHKAMQYQVLTDVFDVICVLLVFSKKWIVA